MERRKFLVLRTSALIDIHPAVLLSVLPTGVPVSKAAGFVPAAGPVRTEAAA